MLGARHTPDQKLTAYATGGDFCRIFREDMDRLYLLSFLLTGGHSLAEKCFVRGLEDAGKGNPVFKEWARSWARRTIIQKAIEIVQPRVAEGGAGPEAAPGRDSTPAAPPEIAAVAGLPAFERFVFVMSVLERNSDRECSLLLDCSRADVAAARARALQRIGSLAKNYPESAATRPGQEKLPGCHEAGLHFEAVARLPVSA